MASGSFWIAMLCQIIIVVGYFWFYRKEQLGEGYAAVCRFLVNKVKQLVPDSFIFGQWTIRRKSARTFCWYMRM